MHLYVGIDAAKDTHWACVISADAKPVFSHAVRNDPEGIETLIGELSALEADSITVALDLLGGCATLLCAMLAEAGFRIVHTPSLAVNRARQGTRGGENKSDPRDAATIADLARTRTDLRPVEIETEINVDIRLLVGRRREVVVDQTRRLARLRDLTSSLFPALERRIDVKTKAGLVFLSLFAAPHDLRNASPGHVVRKLTKAYPRMRGADALAEEAIALAKAQTIDVPGERTRARLVKELAVEALAARAQRDRIDADLEPLLDRHPDAALIRSLPGMGGVLTADFIACVGPASRFQSADALAAAAGLRPSCASPGNPEPSDDPQAATKPSSASSSSRPSMPSQTPKAEPSTIEREPRGNATTKPSSPSRDGA